METDPSLSLFTEYVNPSTLKHTLQVEGSYFIKIEQIWVDVLEIVIITTKGEQLYLTIKKVEWGEMPITQLYIYTSNVFGDLA